MKKRFSKSKDGIPLLQGELYIHIYEAKDLPDMDGKYSFTNPKYYKKIIFMLKVLSSLAMWKFLPKNYFKVMLLKDGLISKARMVNLTVNSN